MSPAVLADVLFRLCAGAHAFAVISDVVDVLCAQVNQVVQAVAAHRLSAVWAVAGAAAGVTLSLGECDADHVVDISPALRASTSRARGTSWSCTCWNK